MIRIEYYFGMVMTSSCSITCGCFLRYEYNDVVPDFWAPATPNKRKKGEINKRFDTRGV